MKPLATLALAGALLSPAAALACGGFFCSNAPVDQQAERILFVQEAADTWSAYVEIQYKGESDAFAWIVPVPEVPELDTWHGMAFDALDQATQPVYQPDGACLNDFAGGPAGGLPEGAEDVAILAQERVGPFDTVTLQSDDARALVEWLRENGYRIVPEMEPFIALYTAEGMKFTAMRLADGEDTDAIEPIKMTYRSMNPVVPLRLTSVAALPEMGVKVWILADQRFGPMNVPDVTVPDAEVRFDFNIWQSNYLPLVARKIDDAGGHGFVTEYAQPTGPLAQTIADSFVPERIGEEGEIARDALAALLRTKPYLTRLYTRVSPEEMDLDPIFHAVDGEDVSRFHQIEVGDDAEVCGGAPGGVGNDLALATACDFAACGASGTCTTPVGGEGSACACAEGTVARAVPDATRPDQMLVSCVDVRLNFVGAEILPPIGQAVEIMPDPCLTASCGEHGECVSMNGFPTCRCETNYVGTAQRQPDGSFAVQCTQPEEPLPIEVFTRELREPNLPYPGKRAPVGMATGNGSSGGCSGSDLGSNAPIGGLFALLLGALPLIRRRWR
jgi:MYXO-CTERM domain-containing protein